jgi:uncharacterized membrane protein (DUF373 family)
MQNSNDDSDNATGALPNIENWLRSNFSQSLHLMEALVYIGVGVLLAVAAVGGVLQAGFALWHGIAGGALANSVLTVLDQLLLVLMMIEILHTVRISLRSQTLMMEPFLIVGLIASIRRVLVITMQAAKMTESGQSAAAPEAFRNSMIELGVIAGLILVFVLSIYFLRRSHQGRHMVEE